MIFLNTYCTDQGKNPEKLLEKKNDLFFFISATFNPQEVPQLKKSYFCLRSQGRNVTEATGTSGKTKSFHCAA